MKKPIPTFRTDDEAEHFVAAADLSKHDLPRFSPMQFEFERKEARLNMRLPAALLAAVKARAQARGVPYTRLVREALERAVAAAPRRN